MSNVVVAIIDIAVFVFGLFLIGTAFATPGSEAVLFFAGILVATVACAVPFAVLDRR